MGTDYKIPPNLPFPKGGNPSLAKRGKGRFFNNDALLMNSVISGNIAAIVLRLT
jgi:hypothetical protein